MESVLVKEEKKHKCEWSAVSFRSSVPSTDHFLYRLDHKSVQFAMMVPCLLMFLLSMYKYNSFPGLCSF